MSVATMLANGLSLPPHAGPPLPPGAVCALSGEPITEGAALAAVISAATSELLDTLGGDVSGYVSADAARCYANSKPGTPVHRPHLAIVGPDGGITYMSPMVSRESATAQGRPCWSDAVRQVWPEHSGRTALVMIVDDMKKRLWPYARVGPLGPSTPVYIHDGSWSLAGIITVDWPAMLDCLALVETAYGAGFSKPAIRGGLLHSTKAVDALGLSGAIALERAVAAWRDRPEFIMATIIAQKPEGAS